MLVCNLTVCVDDEGFRYAVDAPVDCNSAVYIGARPCVRIAKRIEHVTEDVFRVNPGSLLTALKRMERAGWLDSKWRQTESGRRAKYYTLTRAGQRQLGIETEDWARRAGAVGRLLMAEG